MKINIEESNVKRFKKWCESEEIELKDEQDLERALNKFLELNLELII